MPALPDILGGLLQHEMHALGRQAMAIPDTFIVGLKIRQAEFGLVQKQKGWLLGLETSGFEELAAVVHALPSSAWMGREYAAPLAATRQEGYRVQNP